MNFDEYFSDEALLQRLCHYRIKNTQRRHDQHHLRNISHRAPIPDSPGAFDQMFPGRSSWYRPEREQRRLQSHTRVTELGLLRTVTARLGPESRAGVAWATALRTMIDSIRGRALEGPPVIAAPEIRLIEKSPHLYRAIAVYSIPDRVIIGQTARYLGARFDQLLAPNAYSQRMGFESKHRTHHDAVEALLGYRKGHGTEHLWVAECDLRGFFDCVSHDVAREVVQQAVQACGVRGMKIDRRALRVVEAYLNSYSFPTVALPGVRQWLAARDRTGCLASHSKQLEQLWIGAAPSTRGLAQGGALSGLLANLVLDEADRAVLKGAGGQDPRLFYARYVDDMVIAHPDRDRCVAAFERYLTAVRRLKLPVHAPRQIRNYQGRLKSNGKSQYWALKSRAPYSWEQKGTTKASVPWVGFLGYQIRFDGLMRIRPTSVAKQLLKQIAEADAIVRVLRPGNSRQNPKVFPERALKSFVFRLNAIAAGRGGRSHDLRGWSAGFGLLKGRPHVKTQLRGLDRGRGRQLRRLIRWVRTYTGFSPAATLLDRLRRASTSYAGQFETPVVAPVPRSSTGSEKGGCR